MDIAHVSVDPSVKEIHARASACCDLSVDEVECSEGLERIAWHINKLPALDSQGDWYCALGKCESMASIDFTEDQRDEEKIPKMCRFD
jgi:hypothetical protein